MHAGAIVERYVEQEAPELRAVPKFRLSGTYFSRESVSASSLPRAQSTRRAS